MPSDFAAGGVSAAAEANPDARNTLADRDRRVVCSGEFSESDDEDGSNVRRFRRPNRRNIHCHREPSVAAARETGSAQALSMESDTVCAWDDAVARQWTGVPATGGAGSARSMQQQPQGTAVVATEQELELKPLWSVTGSAL